MTKDQRQNLEHDLRTEIDNMLGHYCLDNCYSFQIVKEVDTHRYRCMFYFDAQAESEESDD